MFTAHAITFEGIELQLETNGEFGTRGDEKHFETEEDALHEGKLAAAPFDSIVKVFAREIDLDA
jgi:hypothetical protein